MPQSNGHGLTFGELAESVSVTHSFSKPELIFLNTSDIDRGRVLHRDYTPVATWPGQAKKSVQKGDILFSEIRPANGRYAFVDFDADDYVVSTKLMVIRPKPGKVSPRFLYHFLTSRKITDWLQRLAESRSGTFPQITFDQVAELDLPRLMLEEQRTIEELFDALDDKIEQNRRTARALDRLARAIFRAWFVDFEPVKAKAAGAASFPSMPQAIFDALPTHFVDSDIGPVPAGWEIGGIPSMATLSKVQVKPQEHVSEGFEHFSIPAFDAGMRAVVELGEVIKSNKFLVPEGCVLLSKLNPRIPRIWLPPPPRGRQQIASTEFIVFMPRSAFDRHYLYCQFQQSAFREELAQSASGTSNSHQRVRPNDVLHKAIIVPPSPIRKGFADVADPLFALSAANHAESATLAKVRDYLLPKLFRGQVRVEVGHD